MLLGESYVMPTFFQLDDLVGTVSSHYLNGLDVPWGHYWKAMLEAIFVRFLRYSTNYNCSPTLPHTVSKHSSMVGKCWNISGKGKYKIYVLHNVALIFYWSERDYCEFTECVFYPHFDNPDSFLQSHINSTLSNSVEDGHISYWAQWSSIITSL